jgi:hypothetical protein
VENALKRKHNKSRTVGYSIHSTKEKIYSNKHFNEEE